MLPAALSILVFVLVLRAIQVRRLTRFSAARRPLGPDGVVLGGEGFVLERAGAPAILLIHGGGDTPQTLRYLATELYARGFHVEAPLLPGHGRSVNDFARVTERALMDATRTAYRDINASHEWTAVIGLSMGGALAARLAAETPDLPALGLVAPYLAMPSRIERAARLAWLWGVFAPVVKSSEGLSILDPEEQKRNLAYGVFTAGALRALYALVQTGLAALPDVTAPTLVIQSRTDNRISVAATERAFALLGARDKRLEWTTGAAHVITVDFGRDRVIAALADWMQEHVSHPSALDEKRPASPPAV
jgi:carboxylesterase